MKTRKKITIIGAGNIGGTIAHLALSKGLGDIILFDINEKLAQGKALDLAQTIYTNKQDVSIMGTGNYDDIADSDIIIVTAGIPRKPGMSRDDLVEVNTKVIAGVGGNIAKHSPKSFVLCVTNPLDVMVWVLQESSGLAYKQVIGMGGVLDSSRFAYFLGLELKVSIADIQTFVLGGHGDNMVPLLTHSTVGGIPLPELVKMGKISQETIDSIVQRTRSGGGEIINLLGNGSAFYAPAHSAITMAESYLKNQRRLLAVAAHVDNAYGLKDIYVGVPIILGSNGVEEIIELELTDTAKKALHHSAKSVENLIEVAKKYF